MGGLLGGVLWLSEKWSGNGCTPDKTHEKQRSHHFLDASVKGFDYQNPSSRTRHQHRVLHPVTELNFLVTCFFRETVHFYVKFWSV